MSLHRFFIRQPIDPSGDDIPVPLSADALHHIGVLRIALGEHIVLVDPQGTASEVMLREVGDDDISVRFLDYLPSQEHPHVTLFQAISKGERMDLVFRACTELGVQTIVPVITSRCIVRLEGDKAHVRGDRWRRIAASSAEQSGRQTLPVIPDPVTLETALRMAAEQDIVICPWEEACDGSIRDVLADSDPDARVALFIGPEGGLEPSEVDLLRGIGAKVVTLGPTILRTETAGIVASTLVLSELGALGMKR